MRNNWFSISVFAILICVLFAVAAPAQTISTVAGGGPPNGLSTTKVPLGFPWGVVRDALGNTYISDNLSNRIFKVDVTTLDVSVVAGNSVNNYSGDGGPAVNASLSSPEGMALDTNGALYIADWGNNAIRVVNTSTGSITLFSGTPNQVIVAAGDIATVAGNGSTCQTTTKPCGDGSSSIKAQLNLPAAVALDGAGNLYIADAGDSAIREVTQSNGLINTVAGTLLSACTAAPCSDGSLATAALLNGPNGVYVDSTGDIYIADYAVDPTTGSPLRSAIRAVNVSGAPTLFGVSITQGHMSTVVDTAMAICSVPASCNDGSPAGSALLNLPSGVFMTGSGSSLTMYIADSNNAAVRTVVNASPYTIDVVAGSYTAGYNGTSGPAIGAGAIDLNTPTSVFADSTGVFIADQLNDVIREVSAGNTSTPYGAPQNRAWYGDGGLATSAELQRPFGVAADSAGDLFIADTGNGVIRKVDATTKDISTVVGTGVPCQADPCGDGALASLAQLSAPTSVFLDGSGNMFIADSRNNVIRAVNNSSSTLKIFSGGLDEVDISAGDIATVVGDINLLACTGTASACGDGGVARSTSTTSGPTLNAPGSVCLDKAGNIYVADTGDNVIRVANTQSTKIVIAGVTIQPGDVATVAGDYTSGYAGDNGPASSAKLNHPFGVFVDASGTIYIADGGTSSGSNNRIRAVNPQASGSITVAGVTINAGDIATIAGTGTAGYSGDSGAATIAEFNNPGSIFVDAAGDIFISDGGNSIVRRVNSVGNTQTVVGTPNLSGFSGDGGLATAAQLAHPYGLTGDASGNLLIADSVAWRVRSVTDMVATAPTGTPSLTTLTFPSQATGTTSSAKTVTITNSGVGEALTVASVKISGTNAGDYQETNNCTSVAAGSNCTINVTFAPTATGTRTATLTVTDNAGGVTGTTQTVTLTGTATAGTASFTLPTTGTLTPASVSPGASATATITVTSVNGSTSAVALTCSVSSASASTPLPGCSLSAASVTPAANATASSTLTVTTTGSAAALTRPAMLHRSNTFYAMWLLLPAMLLGSTGMVSAKRRRKILSCLLLALAIGGSVFLVACGGSSNSTGGGGGTGTPAGQYTVTVTATSGSTTQNQALTLTVQ